MPKLSPVSWKDLVKRLRKLGFKGPYEGGKHPFMIKDDLTLTIPNPHSGDISVDLLKRILRRADVTRDGWITLE